MSDNGTARDIAFPRLSDKEIAAFAPHAAPRHFADGEALFQAGEGRGGFFVVLSGRVEIIDNSGDRPQTVTVHEPGEFTGDIDILSHRRPLVSAIAHGDTDVLEVAADDIRKIMADRPALGDLILRAFIRRRQQLLESGYQGLRVIGSGRSRDAYRIREFLARNQVTVTWVDVDEEQDVGELLRAFGLDERELPAIACEGGALLRNPSTLELADAIGLKPPIGKEVYDLIIVGAGPAGLAAAVYGSSEGLKTLVLEGTAPGGQAGSSTLIENYLGFPTGITGAELASRATLQAQKFGSCFSTPSLAARLERKDGHLVVRLDDGACASARCVLIATGAEYGKLDVPGRERFEGLGVYYAATSTELIACRGSEVVIVGAGNSAGQAAMYLSGHARRVLLLVRGDNLRKSMSEYLAERVDAAENVDVLLNTEIRGMQGADWLESVEVEDNRTQERRTIATSGVFTFIGATPHTGWLPPEIETDARGFVKTGRCLSASPNWTRERAPYLLETSQPGVLAAGDVRVGSVKRVSSAVGEGSMAVTFIHEFLAEK